MNYLKPLTKIISLVYILFISTAMMSTTNLTRNTICNCEKELTRVKNTFENNDAGFEGVLKEKRKKHMMPITLKLAKGQNRSIT